MEEDEDDDGGSSDIHFHRCLHARRPRTPAPFHGEIYEDVEDWIDQYNRVTRHNGWTEEQRCENLYYALEGTARSWFGNHEASLTSWDVCTSQLKTAANQRRRERAEDLLRSRIEGPNESITSFVEDVLRVSARADSQANDEKKLRVLMRGVKSEIFGGLVRHPPTMVEEFVAEATNIERALSVRAGHYNRLAGSPTVSTFASTGLDLGGFGIENLREIIRDVVREELKKLVPAADAPVLLSIAEVVREELQRAVEPETPAHVVAPEEPKFS